MNIEKEDFAIKKGVSRLDRWAQFINKKEINSVLEIGVYRGKFAEHMLQHCTRITKYYMLDPWKNMKEWNSLYNFTENMEECLNETKQRTGFASKKRVILRGKTTEVIDQIEDESVEYAYIDGDHSLKGISIDLIRIWPKIKEDGYIAGHDFRQMVWRANPKYEPWLVFPFAIYFAEAMDVKIYALQSSEFLIDKSQKGFEFIDFTNGRYKNTSILHQGLNLPKSHLMPLLKNLWKRMKRV